MSEGFVIYPPIPEDTLFSPRDLVACTLGVGGRLESFREILLVLYESSKRKPVFQHTSAFRGRRPPKRKYFQWQMSHFPYESKLGTRNNRFPVINFLFGPRDHWSKKRKTTASSAMQMRGFIYESFGFEGKPVCNRSGNYHMKNNIRNTLSPA